MTTCCSLRGPGQRLAARFRTFTGAGFFPFGFFGFISGLLTPCRSSRRARALDIAQLQIGHAAGMWAFAGQYVRPK